MRKSARTRLTLRAGALGLLLSLGSTSALASPGATLRGAVVDASGAALVGAQIRVLTPADAEIARATTGASGEFTISPLPPARYVVAASFEGFGSERRAVTLNAGATVDLTLRLELGARSETVTVTPSRGDATGIARVPEFVTVTPSGVLELRGFVTWPQALREETGVHVQQTTTSQGSPYVRGMTGQQVVHLVDGIRFNTSTFRPGANQYTALIEPVFVDRVEIVRGPGSAQYGSDALGGTINVVTRPTLVASSSGSALRGSLVTSLASADMSAGAGAHVAAGGSRWGTSLGLSVRRMQDMRTGGGLDSHSVATRLLGLPSTVLGRRLQDTAYTQTGASARMFVRPSDGEVVTLAYIHGVQRGARRYDQLDGGIGNLIAQFDPQALDFGSLRYERLGAGPLDSITATVSFNAQRDDRSSQGVNNAKAGLRSTISDEENRTRVFGGQVLGTTTPGARHHLSFGAELYAERVSSRRWDHAFDTATGDFTKTTEPRARFPNGATYQTTAAFGHDTFEVWQGRLLASLGARYSDFRYAQTPAGNPLSADDTPTVLPFATSFSDVTFDAGLLLNATDRVALTARAARGFRAPNVNDFGSIGLSGIGFEVSPDEGMRLGARAARIGEETRASMPVQQLGPEVLWSYEAGLKFGGTRVSAAAAAFGAEVGHFIERRTILLSPGAVGQLIGGQPIIRQDASGAVYTALSGNPVYVRVNAGRVRTLGLEASLRVKVTSTVTASANIAAVRATDLETDAPPAIENGVPPPTGSASLRWDSASRPWWVEAYTLYAWPQHRLSGNDLQQARIGAMRTRQEIIDFFNNGAVARALVQNGLLVATGETAAQVATRVLGPDPNARIPLFTVHAGYLTLNLRGGWRFSSRASIVVIAENLLDRNYRTMGSGVDAPGFNLQVKHTFAF